MHLKHSYRQYVNQHQQYEINDTSRVNNKKNLISTRYMNLDRSLNIVKNICARCSSFTQKITIKCINCDYTVYCQNCDRKIHQIGKFINHRRIQIKSIIEQNNIINNLSILQLNQKQTNKFNNNKNQQNIIKMTIMNISQNWDSIIFQISQKFKNIIDNLKDRRKQIIDKVQNKRQQQIKYYQQIGKYNTSFNSSQKNINQINQINHDNNIKKYRRRSNQDLQKNANYIKYQTNQQKIQKNYKISNNLFKEMANLVEKLELKNLLIKKRSESIPAGYPQVVKKSMKNSLIISTNGSDALSPYNKTPTHTKAQLSKSTVECDNLPKIIKETKKKIPDHKQQTNLTKVKSQKIFFQTPLNKEGKQKSTLKKNIKMG